MNETGAIGSIRHLLYHLYPDKLNDGEIWRRNMAALKKRIALFNGRRIIGVAIGPQTHQLADVEGELAGCDCEIFSVKNAPTMRECTTLVKLYEKVSQYTGPEHVTLHAHGKGISSEAWATGVQRWTDALYETCLDYWPVVNRMLQSYPIVGPFKRHYTDWKTPNFTSKSTWHFSGSWRWFRNAEMFARKWQYVEPFWCGSESHPSMVFAESEAGNLVCEVTEPGRALYLQEFWDSKATFEVEQFREQNSQYRQEPLLLTCIITSHCKPDYVIEAIRSVQAQTVDAWHLIVIDSGQLVDKLMPYAADPRIEIVPSGETEEQRLKSGIQAWCVNECFRRGLVRGDLVCYLCDDDRYNAQAFEGFLAAARSMPEVKAWCGKADIVTVGTNGKEKVTGKLVNHPVGTLLDCKCDGMQVCHRRNVTVPWPEQKDIAWHADGMFLRALAEQTAIVPIDVNVGQHRHTPISTFTRVTSQGLHSRH